jgi:hypothetical protein
MRTGSKTWIAPRAANRRTRVSPVTPVRRQGRRKSTLETSDWSSPSKPRRRLRDAALWRDALEVYTSIATPRERWQRGLTVKEALTIHQAAMAHIKSRDPELYRAVQWLNWRDTDGVMAHIRLTNMTWEGQSRKRTARLRRMRTRFRRPGAEPTARAVYSRFLRATDFLTAEVAERQTR